MEQCGGDRGAGVIITAMSAAHQLPRHPLGYWSRIVVAAILPITLGSCYSTVQHATNSLLLPIAESVQTPSVFRVKGLNDDQKVVALTIDDSPSARTDKILNLLQEYHATATFFVHGDRIQTSSDRRLIHRMLHEGHEVANHMPEAYPSANLPPSVFRRQFLRNHRILASLGAKPVRFRPSHGFANETMREFIQCENGAKKLGYRPHFYLASNFCWDVYGMKPESYATFVTSALQPGRITVFHDNQDVPERLTGIEIDQTQRTLDGLPIYLHRHKSQGFAVRSLAQVEASARKSIKYPANPNHD